MIWPLFGQLANIDFYIVVFSYYPYFSDRVYNLLHGGLLMFILSSMVTHFILLLSLGILQVPSDSYYHSTLTSFFG